MRMWPENKVPKLSYINLTSIFLVELLKYVLRTNMNYSWGRRRMEKHAVFTKYMCTGNPSLQRSSCTYLPYITEHSLRKVKNIPTHERLLDSVSRPHSSFASVCFSFFIPLLTLTSHHHQKSYYLQPSHFIHANYNLLHLGLTCTASPLPRFSHLMEAVYPLMYSAHSPCSPAFSPVFTCSV